MKSALITGITGQDGSYLVELLKAKGYRVFGLVRPIAGRENRFKFDIDKYSVLFAYGDIRDYNTVLNCINFCQPDEIYHLAAQSFVGASFEDPHNTFKCNIDGTLNVLEAVKHLKLNSKIYFAASSEMFGNQLAPQSEITPLNPRSPYAVSKVAGYNLCKHYRETYDMFISCGILFNHESPRRGIEFVTRKISYAVAQIHLGLNNELELGNLDPRRDWGFAGDYVYAMWLMLQQGVPDDYVIGTGENHSVADFVYKAFELIDKEPEKYLKIKDKFKRPKKAEVKNLLADPSKAKEELNWTPTFNFDDLVKLMVSSDVALLEKIHGHKNS